MEERFYFLAPSEARNEIDELCVDIESAESFVSVVPDKYSTFCEQAIEEIRTLYIEGKLKAVYQDEDENKVKPLLAKWSKDELSIEETLKLVDKLFVTGQQLYECEKLPEWKNTWMNIRYTYSVMMINASGIITLYWKIVLRAGLMRTVTIKIHRLQANG